MDQQRKARLIAARRVAANLSVQQARSYQTQRELQSGAVRADLERQWAEGVQLQKQEVGCILAEGIAKRGGGMKEAAAYTISQKERANTEMGAWKAEYALEDARYRLAITTARVQRRQKHRPLEEFAKRRQNIMTAERARAAKMRALPPPSTFTEIAATLGSKTVSEELAGGSVPVHVYAPVPQIETPGEAATRVQSETHQRQAALDALVDRCNLQAAAHTQAAYHKALSEAAANRRNEERRREEKRRIAEVYHHAREASVDDDSDIEPFSHAPKPLPPAPTSTARQKALKAAQEAEAEFERAFVSGPALLVRAEARPAAPVRSLEDLLKPVPLEFLLSASMPQPAREAANPHEPVIMTGTFKTSPLYRAACPELWPIAEDTVEVAVVTPSESMPAVEESSPAAAAVLPLAMVPVTPAEPQAVAEHVPNAAPLVMTDASLLTATNVTISTSSDVDEVSECSDSVTPSKPSVMDTSSQSTINITASSTESGAHPSMTAEQLKIALIRLRNRMRNAQE